MGVPFLPALCKSAPQTKRQTQPSMRRQISLISLLVPDYDEGISAYVDGLGFLLLEDTPLPDGKRWVRVGPNRSGMAFLLAKANGPKQRAAIGQQGGGRVWLFLETDDFDRDHAAMQSRGIRFEESPRKEPYGTVAVFNDAFGNRWDLIQYAKEG